MSDKYRALSVLDELIQTESGVTAWEMDFIEDMNSKRDTFWTDRQIETLDNIWEGINS